MIVTGVTARGIIMPIFHEGDALVEIIAQQIVKAAATEGFTLQEGDIVCVTESIVARAQGNYVTCDEIAEDVKRHFPGPVLGIYNPILSRNRAAIQLKAVAQGVEKVIIQLTYPCDEVGNALISWDQIDEHKVNPHLQDFDEEGFAQTFGKTKHLFTGVDYVEYYKNLSDNINIVFSNDTCHLLKYTDQVLCFDVHSRQRSQRLLLQAGAKVALGLDHLMTTSIDGSGFNPTYG
ncbi:MAG: coenzyme F420-0:L-glutamate ligase, partial [Symbiobacteriaceae bacterium]|nr:coenzyme F420-0:L-glutamate ligase [Symbiobacteriaceae bacterium]